MSGKPCQRLLPPKCCAGFHHTTMMLPRRFLFDLIARRLPLVFGVLCVVISITTGVAAEPASRPWDGKPGYCRFSGTISPDGTYLFAWGPAGLSPDVRANLPEWPSDLEINSDKIEVANFLYDVPHKRVMFDLPGFDYFAGQAGWHKNRGALHVAWAADSSHALAISEERWDDQGIVWITPATSSVVDLKDALENAYQRVLRLREKETRGVNIQFREPAILPGNILVLDGDSGHMKQGPYFSYRLTFHITFSGKHPHLELLKARKILENEEHTTGTDFDPDLNTYYKKLRARLDEKGRAALKKEEEEWIRFRDSQPEGAREQLTERRAVELRARAEN